jgi:hypothetical protein
MKPILFSTPMVRALLNTRPNTYPAGPIDPKEPYKCQTRRVVYPQPIEIGGSGGAHAWGNRHYSPGSKLLLTRLRKNSPYDIFEILYAREAFAKDNTGGYIYKADPMFNSCDKSDISWIWSLALHMPREAARIFLEVKNVRVERLREITLEDKKKEGFSDCARAYPRGERNNCGAPCFAKGWDSLNAKRGYGWDTNPYVYVYEFMRLDPKEALSKARGNET